MTRAGEDNHVRESKLEKVDGERPLDELKRKWRIVRGKTRRGRKGKATNRARKMTKKKEKMKEEEGEN